MKPSGRSDVPPFYVMEVMQAASQREAAGLEVLHLEVGQPSTPAPSGALAAASRALGEDRLGYTGAAGIPELRQRISDWYQERYGLGIPMERIVVTTGASGSCVLGFLSVFDAGDRVVVLEPGYPCYRNDLQAFGVDVLPLAVGHESDFRPTIQQLEAVGPVDGLVIASPSNPTGTVLPETVLRNVIDWATAHDVRLVVDEIYHGISFGVTTPSALAFTDDVLILNSFSKYFSMTGWRLGWIVAPPPVAEAAVRLAQSLTIAPPTISQLAALAAFDCIDELEDNVARYRQNRSVVLDGLAAAGFDRIAPADGAFYAWVDVSALRIGGRQLDSPALCSRWLDELGVATTPGIDFDRRRGRDFVRLSYAGDIAEIGEAMSRIATWTTANR